MRLQSQILQTLRAPEFQARLEHIVARGAFESRAALGREVCAQFGFVDACGRAQLAGCLKALAVLETAGQVTLPQLRPHGHRPSPRCLDAPVPAPVEVPAQVRDVEGLRLLVVEDEEQRRVWNTLLAAEHPHGTTPFVGCQIRYLVGSAHGWLGAVGFSASALHLHTRNQTSAETLGLHLHLTLAVSGAGVPLGVLRCGFDEPPQGESEHGAKDNKMQRWLEGLRDVAVAASQLATKTRVLSVMDREADFFELFDEQRRVGGGVDVLVRAKQDRRLGEGVSKLFATLRNAPADGYVEIEIDRLSERRKSSRKQALPARSARVARAEVHYRELTLPATVEGLEPVALWAVHVRESAPLEGEKPLEWFLLTSVRVECVESAVELIGYYLRRWRVEHFFRVLKSGCRAEHLGFHSAERLQRALTIQAVIAWRVMLMTLLAREVPQFDAQLMFTDMELHFLTDHAAHAALLAPCDLAGAVRLVAILGGYQNRKHDPPPGHQLMWRGYEHMSSATLGYRIAQSHLSGADST